MKNKKIFVGEVTILKYNPNSMEYIAKHKDNKITLDPFVTSCLDIKDIYLTGIHVVTGRYYEQDPNTIYVDKIFNL
jgi:hypothetical protein